MDWNKISDKEYHRVLRHYRAYLNGVVEDNAKSEVRVYPVSFDEYAESFIKRDK